MTDWFGQAECKGLDPEMFFLERGEDQLDAMNVCAVCPVRTECLNYALDEGMDWGIWGGTTARRRKAMRRNMPRLIACVVCGRRFRRLTEGGQRYCGEVCKAAGRQRQKALSAERRALEREVS